MLHVFWKISYNKKYEDPTFLALTPISLLSHKFARPPCLYYKLQEIKKYVCEVAFSGVMLISILTEIRYWFEGYQVRQALGRDDNAKIL
jgi:hypothetical protein